MPVRMSNRCTRHPLVLLGRTLTHYEKVDDVVKEVWIYGADINGLVSVGPHAALRTAEYVLQIASLVSYLLLLLGFSSILTCSGKRLTHT